MTTASRSTQQRASSTSPIWGGTIRAVALDGTGDRVVVDLGEKVTGVALVASNFGVCLVPESATMLALCGVVYRPLTDLPENAGVDLNCIYRSVDPSPLLRSFLDTVRAFRRDRAAASHRRPIKPVAGKRFITPHALG